MIHSEDCVKLVASFEGFRAKAYQDQGGVWTLGYGTTKNVHEGDTCTEIEAMAWLDRDLIVADDTIRKYCTVPLNQHQWDALCSLIYNIGASAFSKSTVLDKLIASDYGAAAEAFLLWDKVNHVFNQGLSNRRKAERLVFLQT
jgi:lysozyme